MQNIVTLTLILFCCIYVSDTAGIIFPQITLCDFYFAIHNPVLNKCSNTSKDFMTAIISCLRNDPKFKMEDFYESLLTDYKTLVMNLTLSYGATWKFDLDHLGATIWSKVFHRRFGLCHNLDLTRSKNYSVSHDFKIKYF